MFLLIDIGNSRVKLCLYAQENKNKFLNKQVLAHEEFLNNNLGIEKINFLIRENHIENVIYSSVVPKLEKQIIACLRTSALKIINFKNSNLIKASDFMVNNSEEVGSDLKALFYAYKDEYKNCVIVSMGTATTITLINNRKFVGVNICLGLEISLKTLIENAALLKDALLNNKASKSVIGTDTIEAIRIGVINGHFQMILGLLTEIKTVYAVDKVIWTGGNLNYFKEIKLENDNLIDENAVFKGLIASIDN